MAVTRPTNFPQGANIVQMTVKASSAVTKYMPVTFDTETTCLDATAGQNADGIAMETAVAGAKVQICLLNGGFVIPVKVGTAGATVGEYATVGTTGCVDQTLGGGSTVVYIQGKFHNTGVSGDIVGLEIGQFAGVKA